VKHCGCHCGTPASIAFFRPPGITRMGNQLSGPMVVRTGQTPESLRVLDIIGPYRRTQRDIIPPLLTAHRLNESCTSLANALSNRHDLSFRHPPGLWKYSPLPVSYRLTMRLIFHMALAFLGAANCADCPYILPHCMLLVLPG